MNRLLAKEDYLLHLYNSHYFGPEMLCTDFGLFNRKIPEKSASQVKFLTTRNFNDKIDFKYL